MVGGAVIVVGVARPAWAQADVFPPGVSDSLIERGRRVYVGPAKCASCHGDDARGTDVAPDLTDRRWRRGRGTFAEILDRIRSGVPRSQSRSGVPMPMGGWAEVSEGDLRAVAAYVWSLRRRSGREPP